MKKEYDFFQNEGTIAHMLPGPILILFVSLLGTFRTCFKNRPTRDNFGTTEERKSR